MCWSTALSHESKSKRPIHGTFHIFWYCWTFYLRRIRTNINWTPIIFHWLALGLNWYKKMRFSSLFQREKCPHLPECLYGSKTVQYFSCSHNKQKSNSIHLIIITLLLKYADLCQSGTPNCKQFPWATAVHGRPSPHSFLCHTMHSFKAVRYNFFTSGFPSPFSTQKQYFKQNNYMYL
jgi:hypothetical protein